MVTKKNATKPLSKKTESASVPPLNYDPVIVKKVQAQMLEDNQLSAVSDFFKVLGDETRRSEEHGASGEGPPGREKHLLFPGRPARNRHFGRGADPHPS